MRSKIWFDAYEEAFDRLTDSDCPASLVGEAAVSMANAAVVARADDICADERVPSILRDIINAHAKAVR